MSRQMCSAQQVSHCQIGSEDRSISEVGLDHLPMESACTGLMDPQECLELMIGRRTTKRCPFKSDGGILVR